VDDPPSRAVLFLRGAAGVLALGMYTVAGAVGAVLALVPPALRGRPRGRAEPAGEISPEPGEERLPG